MSVTGVSETGMYKYGLWRGPEELTVTAALVGVGVGYSKVIVNRPFV